MDNPCEQPTPCCDFPEPASYEVTISGVGPDYVCTLTPEELAEAHLMGGVPPAPG